ncbi:UDP-N-acetylglucosamine 4,6-dehydratase (inverting) [Patescibacteria group bacterium]|nr:UDP-N-acetylglucosamine 4,6-dehydratase (inverting) [Patescibacteria group bacterium]MBU1722111.1 UDP-N-acetylglucosamine 4,6-dehydratase (inverting) [Patescibacteria group bacterium]MBU1901601.1 UDP-N-acetylglucosamine 4,6-dehydratase (inverting) [Patescibacteria group bacterium]
MKFLENKTVLITGGTGSFGKSFTHFLLNNTEVKKVIIFSRDELKQYHLAKEIQDDRVRFFLGDIRDVSRLQRAFHGVDIVVHAAALKQVPTLEYNPTEAIKTNVLGTQNIIEAAIDQHIEKVLLISTDKAAEPANLYGSTKLCAEKLIVSGNVYAGGRTKFSCVRYGNVIGSRGSIVDTLLQKKSEGTLDEVFITDERMTRFWLTLKQACELVMYGLGQMEGGEIFIPKAPSMSIVDLLDAMAPGVVKKNMGIRPGEKIHEVLVTEQEARHTVELDKHYVILPEFLGEEKYKKYKDEGQLLSEGFMFRSDKNDSWIKKEEFLDIIQNI